MSCDELVALVREKGPKALNRLKWLDELVDVEGAAAFTGLKPLAVRSYHSQAQVRRGKGQTSRWMWPEPDRLFGGRPAWTLRSIVLGRASMPGRGAGGGRPWHKERGDATPPADSPAG